MEKFCKSFKIFTNIDPFLLKDLADNLYRFDIIKMHLLINLSEIFPVFGYFQIIGLFTDIIFKIVDNSFIQPFLKVAVRIFGINFLLQVFHLCNFAPRITIFELA